MQIAKQASKQKALDNIVLIPQFLRQELYQTWKPSNLRLEQKHTKILVTHPMHPIIPIVS